MAVNTSFLRSAIFSLLACSALLNFCQAQAVGAAAAFQAQASSRPKIGLVLSGGGARGGAHLGVLKVLEDLRVPVDVIVGTSAGSIVGAAYASGLPLEDIEREMEGLSTAVLFRDFSRDDLPYRRKIDDVNNFIGPEIGLSLKGLSLPKGAVAGVSLEAVLRRLTRRQHGDDFNQLPIPFRAVATDLVNGQMVVLDKGSLATAIRASMAIPGAVNPVELDGRLLVDGGLSRNLPVDLAREMGAEIIIAVNVGTPPLKREEITSLLSVSAQMINILTQANVDRSLKELRTGDVLITPELGEITAADFDKLRQAREAGAVAARRMTEPLARLGLDEARYASLMAERFQDGGRRVTHIDEVRVVGTHKVNPEVVMGSMKTAAGQDLDPKTIDADMKRIYGQGDFEGVSYSLSEQPGEPTVLSAEVVEKSWGPNYLRMGLRLSSDFQGNAYFDLLASHRWTWLNRLGAEWRNDLQIGRTDLFRSEWYQPLTDRQRLFVAPRVEAKREPFDVFDDDGARLARYRRAVRDAGLDVGLPIGRAGEVRLGATRGKLSLTPDTALVGSAVSLPDVEMGGLRLRVGVDGLDNLRFPRSGYSADLKIYDSRPQFGADDAYTKIDASFSQAFSSGAHALQVSGRAGSSLGGNELPVYEQFSLGGFLQLSGYQTNQLLGQEMGFVRLMYNYRLAGPSLFDGAYVGGSLEAGRIGDAAFGSNRSSLRHGSSIYLAVDTPLGPVYLGYGYADSRNQAVYFYLGMP